MRSNDRADQQTMTGEAGGVRRPRRRNGTRTAITAVVAAASALFALPGVATASSPKLLVTYQQRLLGTAESDPWVFDDGCVGGTRRHDPMFVQVPLTDEPTTTSACTARAGAPIVVVAAGLTCWQPTLAGARDECETGWADPALALQTASVTVDGAPQRMRVRRSEGCLTFPEGSMIDVPGSETKFYGITSYTTVTGLRPGTHIVEVAFSYADGFNGATTFTITITR